jgi:integrase
MGLGNLSSTSLADARQKAGDARRLVSAGTNPIEARAHAQRAGKTAGTTFGSFADQLVDEIEQGFRNEKHRAQWRMTLKVYAAQLSAKRLDAIETADVLEVLRPIWLSKPETASRLRGRIERVLDAAKAQGSRSGENPARWRGHLSALLPKPDKVRRGHHKAMPYSDVPVFVGRLRASGGVGASALEFLILTAARTGEVTGARWDEVDFDGQVWTVPPDRMKAGREHRVPLSDAALDVLRRLDAVRSCEFIFPGSDNKRPISSATMGKALQTAGGADYTVHGFRSAFRDWVGEETDFPRELAEAALAHVVGDATERAYRRRDALEKRRELMQAWARALTTAAADTD